MSSKDHDDDAGAGVARPGTTVLVGPLRSSLSSFSSSIERNIEEAQALTNRVASAATAAAGSRDKPAPFSKSEARIHADTASAFLSQQRQRTAKLENSLLAVADALLSFSEGGASSGDNNGSGGTGTGASSSLTDFSKLCASVYEANAVELATVEDTMVHRYGYQGTEARHAAIDAMEQQGGGGTTELDEQQQQSGLENAVVDASEGFGEEQMLHTDDGSATVSGTSSSVSMNSKARAPLGTISHNIGDASSSSSSTAAAVHVSKKDSIGNKDAAVPLQPIGEVEAETDTSTSESPGGVVERKAGTSTADGIKGDDQSKRQNDEEGDDNIMFSPPAGGGGRRLVDSDNSLLAPPTPATPATPSLASLHLSQCTATVLGESLDFNNESCASPSSSSSASTFVSSGDSPLSTTSAQREEVAVASGRDVVGDQHTIAQLEGRRDGVAKELENQFGEGGSTNSTDTNAVDGREEEEDISPPVDQDAVDAVDGLDDTNTQTFLEDQTEASDDESATHTVSVGEMTLENDPMFEETIVNDGCSVATVSTIIAERKLAQLMADLEKGDMKTNANVDGGEDKGEGKDNDANTSAESGQYSDEESSSGEASEGSRSSLDIILEMDSDQAEAVQEQRVVQDKKAEDINVGTSKTPILDRYKVQTIDGQLKVSPREAADRLQRATTTSPKVSPFGMYGCDFEDKNQATNESRTVTIDAQESPSNQSQKSSEVPYDEYRRTRKVYPRTPISKLPVPLEADEDEESSDEPETETKAKSICAERKTFEEALADESESDQCDATTQRLSSVDNMPFSPQPSIATPKNVSSTKFSEEAATPTLAINTSVSSTSPASASCRTPLAAAWIERNMPEEKDRLLAILSPAASSAPRLSSQRCSTVQETGLSTSKVEIVQHKDDNIRHLTAEEYDKAPRVVKCQVAMDEVGAAVTALNVWFSSHGHSYYEDEKLEVSEEQAYNILGGMFNRRKAKSICMSLCHWRRLLMQGAGDEEGLKFIVL